MEDKMLTIEDVRKAIRHLKNAQKNCAMQNAAELTKKEGQYETDADFSVNTDST